MQRTCVAEKAPLLSAVTKYLETIFRFHISYRAGFKSGLGYIRCYLILSVSFSTPVPTHIPLPMRLPLYFIMLLVIL